MLQKDLKVLQLAVLEGRRTVGNVMKYLMMGTSSNFGNMFSMAGAALFLASPLSAYITGQTLSVSGGLTMA